MNLHRKSSQITGVSLVHLAIILITSLDYIYTANIIAFFPIELTSSVIFSEAIIDTLAAAGHDITYVTSAPLKKRIENCTVINYQYQPSKHNVPYPKNLMNAGWYTYTKYSVLSQKDKFCFSNGVSTAMDDLKRLGKKYDLLIIPLTFYPKCLYPVGIEFDVPIIGTNMLRSLYYSDELIGNPRNLAYILADFKGSFFSADIFWDRLWNLLDHLLLRFLVSDYNFALYDERFQSRFPHFDVNKLPKLSLILSNNHQSIFTRPLTPNSIDIGGLHISASKELPQNIKTFLDGAEHGAILFSLGSLVSSSVFSSKMALMFRNVFAKLPERVIWKYSENFSNTPPNVLTSKWLPQRDILAHKNINAFITHCGSFGIQEGIYESKPLVMILLNAADQTGNADLMHQKGVGEPLLLKSLTEEKLFNTIRMVIDDKKYQKHMQHLSSVYKDRPMTAQETLIYWVEYVIRYKGAAHMQTAAVDMPFYQYFLLDVLLFLLIIILILIWIGYFIIKHMSRHFLKILKKVLWTADSKKLN